MPSAAAARTLALLPLLLLAACDATSSSGPSDAPETPALPLPPGPLPDPVPGVALAFVLDTSGSMKQPATGSPSSRMEVACRALTAAVDRELARATGADPAARHTSIRELWMRVEPLPRGGGFEFVDEIVESALVTFRGVEVPWGPFDPAPLRKWAAAFRSPAGATPLGNAVLQASALVLASPLDSRHLVVVTDGENTAGPLPEEV
ncbi:MAG: VWA domain-containing protein, partial [Planctomycetes bacterium]|nr:VWA domain-containing protein [Planctomycetota bacterium]